MCSVLDARVIPSSVYRLPCLLVDLMNDNIAPCFSKDMNADDDRVIPSPPDGYRDGDSSNTNATDEHPESNLDHEAAASSPAVTISASPRPVEKPTAETWSAEAVTHGAGPATTARLVVVDADQGHPVKGELMEVSCTLLSEFCFNTHDAYISPPKTRSS